MHAVVIGKFSTSRHALETEPLAVLEGQVYPKCSAWGMSTGIASSINWS